MTRLASLRDKPGTAREYETIYILRPNTPNEDVAVTARPTELDDTSFEKAAQTAADEEDMFLSRGSDESSADDDDEFGGDDDFEVPRIEPNIVPPTEDKE